MRSIIKFLAAVTMSFISLTVMAKGDKVSQTYNVEMHCHSCVEKITKEFTYLKGVTDLKVSLEDKTVWIEYKSDKLSAEQIEKKLSDMGYKYTKTENNQK